jgi:hypothetical protein
MTEAVRWGMEAFENFNSLNMELEAKVTRELLMKFCPGSNAIAPSLTSMDCL